MNTRAVFPALTASCHEKLFLRFILKSPAGGVQVVTAGSGSWVRNGGSKMREERESPSGDAVPG